MPQLVGFLKALADPNRLRILNILSHRSLCVCDLQAILDLSQPFISRHLAYLRRAGLVIDRRQGARVCYSLLPETPMTRALQTFLRELFLTSPVFQADVQKLLESSAAGRLKSLLDDVHREELDSRAA
jgi:ArsR family transcriptional regulator